MKGKIQGVFLDWHGVIYDGEGRGRLYYKWTLYQFLGKILGFSEEAWEKVENEAYRNFIQTWKEGAEHSDIPYREVMHHAEAVYYRTIYRAGNIPDNRSEEEIFHQSRELNFKVASSYDAIYPDVRPVLEKMRNQNLKLFIITSATEEYIKGSLVGSRLESYFDEIFSAEKINRSKFQEEFWQEAYKTSEVSPEFTIVVDDSLECLRIPCILGALGLLLDRSTSQSSGDAPPFPTIHSLREIFLYL